MLYNILFQAFLVATTLFCSIVAGFLFAFAVVAMPGIKKLPDRDYIRAFQVIDGVIQRNQPLFILVWVGSIPLMLLTAISGFWMLDMTTLALLLAAATLYLAGVQFLTITQNIPLNNRLQAVEVDAMTDEEAIKERHHFESRWNYWNLIRTPLACLTALLLLIVLAMV